MQVRYAHVRNHQSHHHQRKGYKSVAYQRTELKRSDVQVRNGVFSPLGQNNLGKREYQNPYRLLEQVGLEVLAQNALNDGRKHDQSHEADDGNVEVEFFYLLLEFIVLEREQNFNQFVFDCVCVHIEVLPDFWVEYFPHHSVNF